MARKNETKRNETWCRCCGDLLSPDFFFLNSGETYESGGRDRELQPLSTPRRLFFPNQYIIHVCWAWDFRGDSVRTWTGVLLDLLGTLESDRRAESRTRARRHRRQSKQHTNAR